MPAISVFFSATMNIGFDAKRIFYNETGLGNYSRTLVKLLKANYPDENYFLFSPAIRGQRAIKRKKEFLNYNIVEPTRMMDRMFSTRWRNSSMIYDLARYDLDIYHGLTHEIPRKIEQSGIKSVVTIHDLIFLRYPQFYKPWDVLTYKKKYLDSCYRADAIIAISENTKKDIMEFLDIPAEKIHVIYQSAGQDYYEFLQKTTHKQTLEIVKKKYNLCDPYLLYVGSFNKRKNLIPLIKSISLLKNKKLNLILVGGGSEKRTLEKTALHEGVSQQVKFLTGVPGEDLPGIYHGARVFIYPSIYEGFGIPIIESLLCQTPVITNTGSCFHEAAGNGGIFVDVTNPRTLAEAIEYLLIEKNNRQYAKTGFNYAQKFSEQNFVKNTYDLYKSILSK